MLVYAVNLIYLLFFLFIYLQDRRRLINGFLFFILLMLSGLSLVMLTDETGNPFLFFLLIIIAMAAALLLFTGVFIILAISFYSAVNLLRKEGRSKANLLSLLVGIGILLWLVLGMLSFKNVEINDVLSVIMLVVNTILLYLLLVFSNFILSSFIYGIYRPVLRQDYIIVLGSGLMGGNKVTPLLAGRIDRALKVYRRQADKKKSPPMLIMSGGQGGDQQIAEGEAMKQYALEQGIPEDHILVEDQSKNTYENMLFFQTAHRKPGSGYEASAHFVLNLQLSCFPGQASMPERQGLRLRALARKQNSTFGITRCLGSMWQFWQCIKRRILSACLFCWSLWDLRVF